MIDSKVFEELMNRGVITVVGLNPENYNDIDDLQRFGLATGIEADTVYKTIVEENLNKSEDSEPVQDDNYYVENNINTIE
jgi:hypothetical protein